MSNSKDKQKLGELAGYKDIRKELYGDERYRSFEFNKMVADFDFMAVAGTQTYISLVDYAGFRKVAPFLPTKSDYTIVDGLEIIIPKMINYFDVNGVFMDNYYQICAASRFEVVMGGNLFTSPNSKNARILDNMILTPIDGTGFSRDYKRTNPFVLDKGQELGLLHTIVTPATNLGLDECNMVIRWYGKYFIQTY